MNGRSKHRAGHVIRSKGGFTLIELLVVVAVIALLLGVLVPTLQRVRSHAKAVACRSNLRQLGVYLHAYAAANDGKVYIKHHGSELTVNKPPNILGSPCLLRLLRTYWQDCNDAILCPATKRYTDSHNCNAYRREAPWRIPLKYFTGYPDSMDTSTPPYIYGSYGSNNFVGQGRYRASPPRNTIPWYTVDVQGAVNIPVFLDCLWVKFGELGPPPRHEAVMDLLPRPSSADICINRHDGGINCTFLDGSVRKVGLKELWTLKWDRDYNTAGPWTKAGGVKPEDWPEWMRGVRDY